MNKLDYTEALFDWYSGLSVQEIADRQDVPYLTAYQGLRRKLPQTSLIRKERWRSPVAIKQARVAEAKHRLANKQTREQIAREMKLSINTIWQYLPRTTEERAQERVARAQRMARARAKLGGSTRYWDPKLRDYVPGTRTFSRV